MFSDIFYRLVSYPLSSSFFKILLSDFNLDFTCSTRIITDFYIRFLLIKLVILLLALFWQICISIAFLPIPWDLFDSFHILPLMKAKQFIKRRHFFNYCLKKRCFCQSLPIGVIHYIIFSVILHIIFLYFDNNLFRQYSFLT